MKCPEYDNCKEMCMGDLLLCCIEQDPVPHMIEDKEKALNDKCGGDIEREYDESRTCPSEVGEQEEPHRDEEPDPCPEERYNG